MGIQVKGFETQTRATAKGRLARRVTAIKAAAIISNGIGKNAQKIPTPMPLAVLLRLNVQSSVCFKLSPKI